MNVRRFDALDSARASMMVLGVFVHTAIVLPLFYPDHSYGDGLVIAGIYQVIHIFRMPTFFFLAGIFASALLAKSSYVGFLISRFKRIVSVLIVAGAIIALVLLPNGCVACSAVGSTSYLDNGWLHLWFLFYLALITHLVLFVHWFFSKAWPAEHQKVLLAIAKRVSFNPAMLLALSLLTLLIPGFLGNDGALKMTFALLPDAALLSVFALFYLVGWISFYEIDKVFNNLKRFSVINLTIGSLLGIAVGWLSVMGIQFEFHSFLYTAGMWFITAGVVGIFIRFVPNRTRVFGFLTDASYWVYLWHPIFVLLFGYLCSLLGLNLWVSFALTSLLALGITAYMYEWLIKDTLTDKWLSGRRRRELSKQEIAFSR